MRLGGPVFGAPGDPDGWARAVVAAGYRAAYCPVGPEADDATVRAYADAAARHDVVIAEVGAWSNTISPDDAIRRAAIVKSQAGLDLADRIGARCCVNIAGARGEVWDGPHADNFSDDTFALIVDTVHDIIDAVRPTRTCYTLETMPWVPPDSPKRYKDLIDAIDRDRFAVHFDPVNMVNSVTRYWGTGRLISQFCKLVGPWIKSCHAKDITLQTRLTVHLDEVRPGLGNLDYPTFLREVERLDPDLPVMLEHLPDEAEYRAAAEYVRGVAAEVGIAVGAR